MCNNRRAECGEIITLGKIASELLEQNALECLKERMHMFKTVSRQHLCCALYVLLHPYSVSACVDLCVR